jgi:hypothetical protein
VQNQNLVLAGASSTPVVAQCACEGMEMYSTATFTFQYATRASEIPPAQPGQTQGQTVAAQPNGDASVAESITASDFKFVAESARNQPWAKGETIGFVVGVNAQVIVCRPRRAGGS